MSASFDSDVNITVEIAFDSDPLDNSLTFTDVSQYVRAFTINRGRSNELGQFVAGTSTISLSNTDNRFNPTQTTHYYDASAGRTKIQPLKVVRIKATYDSASYTLFHGHLDVIPVQYIAQGNDSIVTFTAVDSFKIFRSQTLQSVGWSLGLTGFSEIGSSTTLGYDDSVELTSTRVTRILNSMGFPSSFRSIDTGTLNIQQQPATTNILTALQECETVENAQLFIAKDGKVTFRNRAYKFTNTKAINVQATFDNSGSNLPYQEVATSLDTNEVINNYTWTRNGGTQQKVADADSINRFTAKNNTQTTKHTSDANVLSVIQQKLAETSTPQLRIDQLIVNPRVSTSLWSSVLGLEFGDRVKVNITNPNGSVLTDEVFIESISHNVNAFAQQWVWTINLSPAGSSGWVLGQAKLGEGTRFAYA